MKAKLLLFAFFALSLITTTLKAQDSVHVSGWTYHRYGEYVGFNGNRFLLFTPDNYNPAKKYRLIVYQHGAGGNPEDIKSGGFLQALTAKGVTDAIVIAPHFTHTAGEWRFNDTSLTSTKQFLAHLHKARRDFNVYEKIALTGFSLGGQFSSSYGMFLPGDLMLCAPSGGGNGFTIPAGIYYHQNTPYTATGGFPYSVYYYPYASRPAHPDFKTLRWLVTCGQNDDATRLNGGKRLARTLDTSGAPVDTLWEPGVGHSYGTAMKNKFIDEYLKIDNTNQEPLAAFTATTGATAGTVQFDASGSSDPDGTIDRYRWVIEGKEYFGPTHQHTFTGSGPYLIRLRVTDDKNDRNTLYKNLSLQGGSLTLNTPPRTKAVKAQTDFDTEYDLKPSAFLSAYSDQDGDPLTKIKILSDPYKGELRLNGQTVKAPVEIKTSDIRFLSYVPLAGNSDEDFFEFAVYDGLGWGPFKDNRFTITIEKPKPKVFSNLQPQSGLHYEISTGLDSASLYFTNEQSALSEVHPFFKGNEYVKTHSSDKNLTGNGTLTFDLLQDADVYVAYDGRAGSPPVWLTSGFAFFTSSMLKSWFYFDVYKRTYAKGTVTLGGNAAAGATNVKSMYFLIGVPSGAGALPPKGLDSTLNLPPGAQYAFSSAFFNNIYLAPSGSPLDSVRITRLPFEGDLVYNGATQNAPFSVAKSDLIGLVYQPPANYSGFDNFRFSVVDAAGNVSEKEAKVYLNLGLMAMDKNLLGEDDIALFPNPSAGLIEISGLTAGSRLEVFASDGRLIRSVQIKENKESLDLSGSAPGLYLLRVIDDKSIRIKKLILK